MIGSTDIRGALTALPSRPADVRRTTHLAAPHAGDIDVQLQAATNHLLIRRLRIGLLVVLTSVPVVALVDLRFDRRVLGPLYALKACVVLFSAAAYVLLNRPRFAARATVLAWLTGALVCVTTALSGIIAGESITPSIICLSATLVSAMALPWSGRAQLSAAAVAAISVGANLHWVHGNAPTPDVIMGVVVVLIMLAMSVVLNLELQRHRIQSERSALKLQHAERQVSLLNEGLERRVQERTAQLEAARQQLETEMADRRLADKALRASQSTLAALIESSADAIWSIDRDYRLVTLNSVAKAQFRQRYGSELSIGTPLDDTAPPELQAFWRPLYDRAFAGERLTIHQVVTGDGAPRHFLFALNPITDAGTTTGVTVFAKDITPLKQAEEQARQHQAALAHVLRLGTMGEMVASLAHEINQPLGAITNYARGCQRRLGSGNIDTADLGQVTDQIAEEAMRAGEILRRLRSLIRKEPPQYEPVDVNQIATDAIRFIRSEAHLRGVTVRLVATPELPHVIGDGVQIEQVLMNLLLNAIDAMTTGTDDPRELTVQTAPADAAAVEVSVHDTGIGLTEQIRDRAFDAFFTTKPNGLGMGLAISRSIIEAHNGRLWVTPNADRGSTFHFTLPVA